MKSLKLIQSKLQLLLVGVAFVLASTTSYSSVTIPVVEDAFVGSFTTTLDTNFGSSNGLSVFRNANGIYKSYFKLDATGLPTLTSVESISLFNVLTASNLPIEVYFLSGVDSATWSESTITWNNAPGVGTGFAFDPSVSPLLLTSRSDWSVTGYKELEFNNIAGGQDALLTALNTGSRQATIGITGTSWVSGQMNFYSIDETAANTEPFVTAIPEPSTAALILGFVALVGLGFRYRRKA